MAEPGDVAGVALSGSMDFLDGLIGEERRASRVAGLREPELNQLLGFVLVERIQDVFEADAIEEIADLAHAWQELQLGHQDELEQLVLVGLVVEQSPEDFQGEGVQLLRLVNEQHDRFALLNAPLKEERLDRLAIVEDRRCGGLQADLEGANQGRQEPLFGFMGRIEDHVEERILSLPEELEQLPG